MELKYKNWNDITIGVYKELNEILKFERTDDEIMDEVNLSIALLSTLCDADEDEVASLTINDFKALAAQCAFLNEMPKVRIKDKYIINGKEYRVQYNVQDMTMAQYIDYQTFVKEKDKHLSNIIACFLIPKGKKYGDGYDIQKVKDDIGNHLSIVDANSILFFFVLLYQSLTKAMLTYSIRQMKKARKKMNKEEQEKIDLAIAETKRAMTLVGNGYGYTL